MDLEMAAMELVGNSGESRSLSFEALYLAKEGKIGEAQEKIKEAKQKMLAAHSIQTELICKEADGEEFKLGLLMVHAQDHLMTTMTLKEVASEMLHLYKKVNETA